MIGASYELPPGALMTTNSPESSFGLKFDYRLANRLTVRPCDDGCGATRTVVIGYAEAHADFFVSDFDIDRDAGPAFSRDLRLSGPAIVGIFGDQRALDFGTLTLDAISIRVGDPQPVPLPAAFWPLAGAVGLLLAHGRKRL